MSEAEQLIDEAIAILEGVPALQTRRAELLALRENAHADALHVGVIGITSSGKTTFINALMGEPLLPEEARATTNLLVKCRHGAERQATVYYRDGREPLRLRGPELTARRLAELCSETLNPGNRAGLSWIEWTTTTSCIPDGLILVDTPGLDAEGHQEHQDITMRQFLPLADIVLYMTSIRNPFKKADLQAVESVLENDQRILFLLSQIDLEKDSTQGSRTVKTRAQKLDRHHQRLEADLRAIRGLRNHGIELISSHLAKQGIADRAGEAWRSSRFPAVLSILEGFREELKDLVEETRALRVRVQLNRVVRELDHAEHRASTGIARKDDAGQGRLAALTAALKRMRRVVRDASRSAQIDAAPWLRSIERATASSRSREAMQELFEELEGELSAARDRLVSRTDRGQRVLRKVLEQLKIQPARARAAERHLGTQRLRSVDTFVSMEERRVRTRGWFDRLAFWPKTETQLYAKLDARSAVEELERYVRETERTGNEYLAWWHDHVGAVFIDPVQEEHGSEEAAARDMEKLLRQAEREREAIRTAREAIARLEERVPSAKPPAPRPGTRAEDDAQAAVTLPAIHAGMALLPLLATFRELELYRTFRKVLSRARRGSAPVVALGRDRASHLRLTALLAHDLRMLERLEQLPAEAWIVSGPASPVVPGPVHRVEAAGTFLEQYPLVVAPDDVHLPDCPWVELLAQFSALLLEVDMPRISAGLSDLCSAPYRAALTAHAERLVFTCGNGAFFAENRFGELVHDVLPLLRSRFGARPVLVYEDYDARHTDLLELREEAIRAGNPRELPRLWSEAGLHFDPPFTSAALKELDFVIEASRENR